jgi:anti-sigma regulatory factor (Ser/Thr protein kinase)
VVKVKPSIQIERELVEPLTKFAVKADFQSLDTISEHVNRACRSQPSLSPSPKGDDFIHLVELAVSEICTNIIQHSYRMASGEIRGCVTSTADEIQIDLYDDGESFDLSSIPEPSAQAETLNEGGYGLHIVRQIMDEVAYRPNTPNGNHWQLIKKIATDSNE